MSGDGYEYPDEAGYPDGTGTLHEGIEDVEDGAPDEDEADAAGEELDSFAMQDERDVEGD